MFSNFPRGAKSAPSTYRKPKGKTVKRALRPQLRSSRPTLTLHSNASCSGIINHSNHTCPEARTPLSVLSPAPLLPKHPSSSSSSLLPATRAGAMLQPQPPWPSRHLLQSVGGDSGVANPNRIPGIPPADPPSGVNSDVVVILAALLCALICVIGLAAVARCARSRRNRAAAGSDGGPASPTSNAADAGLFGGGGVTPVSVTTTTTTTTTTSKGLKKKALKALPKLAYADAVAAAAAARGAAPGGEGAEGEEGRAEEVLSECPICLSEFGEREEVRVMPQCGHGFHVACVDTWLRSNSSCPSCRRPIVLDDPAPPKRCRKCEAIVLEAVVASSSSSSSTAAGSSRNRGGGGFLP